MHTLDFALERSPSGRLALRDHLGVLYEGVVPVRPFPISAPNEGLSLVDALGHERAWIPDLDALPVAVRSLLIDELSTREFTPEIQQIIAVSGFITPCAWTVVTDRGNTSFVLKGEEDIRRLAQSVLLIADNHGIQYLIRDLSGLDRKSRKLLDRFL